MNEAFIALLKDMRFYAQESVDLMGSFTFEEFNDDKRTFYAVVKTVETIGEAANKISTEQKKQLPQIPWYSIIGARHAFVHGYGNIKIKTLYKTITESIPELIIIIDTILESSE